MSKALMKSLDLDLPALAQILRSKGRKGDTILAHITPKEAALLKRRGGSGTKNPATGLPEYDDGEDYGGSGISYSPQTFDYSAFSSPLSSAPDQGTGLQLPQANVSDQGQITYDQPLGLDVPADQSLRAQYISTPDIVTGTPQDVSQNQALQSQINQDLSGYTGGGTTDTSGGAGGGDKGFNANSLLSALGGIGGLARMGAGAGTAALGAQAAQKAAAQGQDVVNQIQALAPQTQARGVTAANQLGTITQPGPAGFGTGVAGKVRELAAPLTASITAAGAPLKTAGTELMSQSESGALTPGQLTALRALQAQNQQGIANRGGVGAQQAGASESAFIADQLQKDYQQGLQEYTQGAQYDVAAANFQRAVDNYAAQLEVTGINTALTEANLSDGYVINALNVGLQNDRLLAQSLQQFYSQVAQATFGSSAMLQQPKYNTSTGQLIQRYDPNTGEALA
jgi:hypothetical protein